MQRPALVLDVSVFFFAYTGNSGGSAVHTDIMEWWVETVLKMKSDPRVGAINVRVLSDTPITMTRNAAVLLAREDGAHVCIWVDSDQSPNSEKNKYPGWKPFWDVAFTEIYNNYGKGPLVIGCPYVGSPAAGCNVFVFQWSHDIDYGDETRIRLEQFSREDAAKMSGVHEVAALPTGLIMFDMRCFELIEPTNMTRSEALDAFKRDELSKTDALRAMNDGWCYYEWQNGYAASKSPVTKETANRRYGAFKASTEDVQLTRDISLAGMAKLGYNPVRCAFDCWIGHWKPECVGKPLLWSVDQVAATFRKIVETQSQTNETIVDLKHTEAGDFWSAYEQKHGAKQAATDMVARVAPFNKFISDIEDCDAKEKRALYGPQTTRTSQLTLEPVAVDHDGVVKSVHTLQHEPCKIINYHWGIIPEVLAKVRDAAKDCKRVVDIGPGKYPCPFATEFVGRRAVGIDYGDKPFHEIDLERHRLPYDDQSVDFVYCRHTIEDLTDPEFLLSEIARVAKSGYIETPSPMAELTHGVDAPGIGYNGRGYIHHQQIVWSTSDTLFVIHKYPVCDNIDMPGFPTLLNDDAAYWNTYHLWTGTLKYIVYKNETDFKLGVDGSYFTFLSTACALSRVEADKFVPIPSPFDTTTDHKTPQVHLDALTKYLQKHRLPKHTKDNFEVVEIGTWKGDSAIALAKADKKVRVLCVDTWQGSPSDKSSYLAKQHDIFAMCQDNISASGLGSRITLLCADSVNAAKFHHKTPHLYPSKYDAVLIDAEHTYEAVKADIQAWWPLLSDDGVMIGHDYGAIVFPGVAKAVHEIFGHAGDGPVQLLEWSTEHSGYWVVEKARAIQWFSQQRCPVCDIKDGTVTYDYDPYAFELEGDRTPVLMCAACRTAQVRET